MTAKEKITSIIQGEGYDAITAMDLAQDCLDRYRANGGGRQVFRIGRQEIILGKD
jgi:hypothetical protein